MQVKAHPMLYGVMVVWDEVDDAVRYFVNLKIEHRRLNMWNNYETMCLKTIKTFEVDRNQLYASIDKLAYLNLNEYIYHVSVVAEGKDGNKVDESGDTFMVERYVQSHYGRR